MISLGRWAARSPSPPWPMLRSAATRSCWRCASRFDPDAATGLRARYELRLGEDRFRIEVSDDVFEVDRGGADQADATIDTDPDTLARRALAGRTLADAQRAGDMTIEGDKAAVKRLVRLFPMPEPAASGR